MRTNRDRDRRRDRARRGGGAHVRATLTGSGMCSHCRHAGPGFTYGPALITWCRRPIRVGMPPPRRPSRSARLASVRRSCPQRLGTRGRALPRRAGGRGRLASARGLDQGSLIDRALVVSMSIERNPPIGAVHRRRARRRRRGVAHRRRSSGVGSRQGVGARHRRCASRSAAASHRPRRADRARLSACSIGAEGLLMPCRPAEAKRLSTRGPG